MSENDLVAAIAKLVAQNPYQRVEVGIGDDAAVWQPSRSRRSVVTADALVEGVHFNRAWMSDAAVGKRAMVANLSDLAAMGAHPVLATVVLGVPATMSSDEVLALYRGMLSIAAPAGLAIAGGDLTRSPSLTIAITAIGEVRPSNLKLRSGARVGDAIVTTGALGASRAGLDILSKRIVLKEPHATIALEAYRAPKARLAEGRWLAASSNVRAMMDCSDGLSTDLARLCAASGVGARLDEVPVAPSAAAAAEALGESATQYALAGGEDFELIATVVPRALNYLAARFQARFGRALHRVGEITAGGGMMLRVDGKVVPLAATGYDHFGE